MPRISELFAPERAPTRPLDAVVDAETAINVRSEVDEYVFTAKTRGFFKELATGILDSAQGAHPDSLRTWISGYFGSGKSHFLKLAITLFSNPTLQLDDGSEVPALRHAVDKHAIDVPWKRLANEFHVRGAIVNLAIAQGGTKIARQQPLLYRLLAQIGRGQGLSPEPHIASLERELQRLGRWSEFLALAAAACAEVGEDQTDWTAVAIRGSRINANPVLQRCLVQLLPARWPDAAAVRRDLADREGEEPSAETVVRLARAWAESLHPNFGRVILGVDEVSLYLQGATDRVREVQGLAEVVKSHGGGRVFLWATAQQDVEALDASLAGVDRQLVFLSARFPERQSIEETDIDEVVRKRWLAKDPTAPAYAVLKRLLDDGSGELARGARLHHENLVTSAAPLTNLPAVLASYPLLPYHVRLIQQILVALRGSTAQDQTSAQSRALLSHVRSLFEPNNGGALAKAEVGQLATFDLVYDSLREPIRKVDSTTDAWIATEIAGLPAAGAVSIASVAKVIFLLQRLNPPNHLRIMVDAENVAALLYPRLGASWDAHLVDVRAACERLVRDHFVSEDSVTGYRFYHSTEKTFRAKVASQPVDDRDVDTAVRDAVQKRLRALGLDRLKVMPWHELPVRVDVQIGVSKVAEAASGLALHVVIPRGADTSASWRQTWSARADVVIWGLADRGGLEERVRESLKLDQAIRRETEEHGTAEYLRAESQRLVVMREQQIPLAVDQALGYGKLTHSGEERLLSTNAPAEDGRRVLESARESVFTEMDTGLHNVDDVALKRLFSWIPPQPLPDVASRLGLFDAEGHLLERAIVREVLLTLKSKKDNERTGAAILAVFEDVPFGWPQRVVRAALGALLRARRITVQLSSGERLRSHLDKAAVEWVTSVQTFNKSTIFSSGITLSQDEQKALAEVFKLALERPGCDTLEKLDKAQSEVLPELATRARSQAATVTARGLPGAPTLERLAAFLEAAVDEPSGVARLRYLLDRGVTDFPGPSALAHRLAVPVSFLKVVEERRTQLDAISAIAERVRSVYSNWANSGATAAQRNAFDELRRRVQREALFREHHVISAQDENVFQAYAKDYARRHGVVSDSAREAEQAVTGHAGWARLAAPDQEKVLTGLREFACSDSAPWTVESAPRGVCPVCGTAYGSLTQNAELIESRRDKALRRLDALVAPPPPPPDPDPVLPTRQTRVEVDSRASITAAHEALDTLAAALPPGRWQILIQFEEL